MTDVQTAAKIAKLAWELQPKFRHRFESEEDLAARILAGYKISGAFGWFLPVFIIETFCNVDDMKATIAHHQMDEAMGITTVSPVDLMSAKLNLRMIKNVMPMFEEYCGTWIDGDND